MKLLALVLLLSALPSLTLTKVVTSFPQVCPSFFMLNPRENVHIVPTIFTEPQYKMICQRWKTGYRFATLYDTKRRIPVYSAYTISQEVKTKRNTNWKIEPQLETQTEGYEEMINSLEAAGDITHQAVNSDYNHQMINNTNYTRGHLFPCGYAGDQDQADSTFTLTNIAPQSKPNNGKWSKQMETPMLDKIIDKCSLNLNQPAYIVTGVVPGDKWLKIKRNNETIENGINIPSHFWSAFCCKNGKGNLLSGAYIAEQGVFKRRRPSIDNLNIRLTELYGQEFNVFPGSDC